MTTATPPAADCYARGDRRLMERSQQLRARLLGPLLERSARAGLSADHLTLLSTTVGLLFVPAWLSGHPALAGLALALHVALDGLDGPLARFRGEASRRGSFTDTVADHLVMSAATLAVAATGHLSALLAGLYLVSYTLVLAFSMVRNALAIPYAWLVRPRFVVYLAGAALPLWAPALDVTVAIASALLLAKAASGFWHLRRAL